VTTEIRVTTPLSAATAADLEGLFEDAVALRPAHLVIDLTDPATRDADDRYLVVRAGRWPRSTGSSCRQVRSTASTAVSGPCDRMRRVEFGGTHVVIG
jgi:hypothetical protein